MGEDEGPSLWCLEVVPGPPGVVLHLWRRDRSTKLASAVVSSFQLMLLCVQFAVCIVQDAVYIEQLSV